MSVRLSAAVAAGQAAALLSRRFGLGGGTVIAGHVAQRVYPRALQVLAARLPSGCLVLSGTNGKTTTSRLLASMLAITGLRPLHNRAGANLMTGLTTAVIENASALGRPRAGIGVFEVDEATAPAAVAAVHPRFIVLTNLFRDQLDRYGEVEFVASLWREMITSLPSATTLILNADDPLVAILGADRENVLYFGVDDSSAGSQAMPHAVDARLCQRCGGTFQYSAHFYGHLGHYHCPNCGWTRPTPAIRVTSIASREARGSRVTIATPTQMFEVEVRLPGLYNVYNALTAAACATALGISVRHIQQGCERFEAAFGRLERVQMEQRELLLALVKNPVGFNEVLRTVLPTSGTFQLILAINDLFADGTDISWLWDIDFELLADRPISVICTGLRADDMAVRLKYARLESHRIVVAPEIERALEMALAKTEPGETVFMLPTYTAMLETRNLLRKMGYVRGFWED
ncbi:MAG: MurT ligase domain-containing protein [Chloroflexota bacterium]